MVVIKFHITDKYISFFKIPSKGVLYLLNFYKSILNMMFKKNKISENTQDGTGK